MRPDRWRLLMLALAVLTLALGGAACGDDEEEPSGGGAAQEEATPAAEKFPADTTMGKIQSKGEIAIGVKYDVPPFGFKNPNSGAVEGFDVDFGKAVADKLGVKPKLVEAISDNRIPFIQDGTVDLDPLDDDDQQRARRGDRLHEPVLHRARAGSSCRRTRTSPASRTSPAARCARRSARPTRRRSRSRRPKADLRLVDAYSECLELLQNGAVDAISTDDVILTGMIIQDDSLKLVGDELTVEPYGGGFKKDDAEFAEFLNGVLDEYKSSGAWQKSYDKWLGQYTGESGSPPTQTLQEVLAAEQ